jgi:GABA permease
MNTAYPSAVQTGQVERLLAVANETLEGDAVVSAIRDIAVPGAQVQVVCPALVSRTRFWTSDLTAGIVSACGRLEASLVTMCALGLRAEGVVGDADPILAIEDALRLFAPDHLLISTHPASRSTWLERRVVERACARFALPISHVIVDLNAPDGVAEPSSALHARAS